jgi:hypothetical protein
MMRTLRKHAWMPLISILLAYTASAGEGGRGTLGVKPPTSYKSFKSISDTNPPLQACDRALKDCQAVIAAQDEAIARMKEDQRQLLDKLAESKPSSTPTWLLLLTAGLAGFVVGTVAK